MNADRRWVAASSIETRVMTMRSSLWFSPVLCVLAGVACIDRLHDGLRQLARRVIPDGILRDPDARLGRLRAPPPSTRSDSPARPHHRSRAECEPLSTTSSTSSPPRDAPALPSAGTSRRSCAAVPTPATRHLLRNAPGQPRHRGCRISTRRPRNVTRPRGSEPCDCQQLIARRNECPPRPADACYRRSVQYRPSPRILAPRAPASPLRCVPCAACRPDYACPPGRCRTAQRCRRTATAVSSADADSRHRNDQTGSCRAPGTGASPSTNS